MTSKGLMSSPSEKLEFLQCSCQVHFHMPTRSSGPRHTATRWNDARGHVQRFRVAPLFLPRGTDGCRNLGGRAGELPSRPADEILCGAHSSSCGVQGRPFSRSTPEVGHVYDNVNNQLFHELRFFCDREGAPFFHRSK